MKFSAEILIFVTCFLRVALGIGIEPELTPESDNKFMKKDYPDDKRPKVINKFGHPYPTIQDDTRYDKDYVKDENDDGGYWKTQMEYDRLKNLLSDQKGEHQAALERAKKEQSEYEKA